MGLLDMYQYFPTLYMYKLYMVPAFGALGRDCCQSRLQHFLVSCFSVLTERGPTVCFTKLSRQIQDLRKIVFKKNFVKVSLIFYTFIDMSNVF